eukprot:1144213-Pelagomonas_calceolata.AAC.1
MHLGALGAIGLEMFWALRQKFRNLGFEGPSEALKRTLTGVGGTQGRGPSHIEAPGHSSQVVFMSMNYI